MSDASQGPGWWLAADGKWYPPEQAAPPPPSAPPPPAPPPPVAPPPPAAAPPSAATPTPEAAPTTPMPVAPAPTAVAVAPTAPAASAPASSSNGCLKAFLIVFAILFVLGVGAVILFVFVLGMAVDKAGNALDKLSTGAQAETHYEDQTGIASNPIGFDQAHPPQLDIWKRTVSCSTDATAGTATASGTVQNHSTHPSSYLITVSFSRDGTEVGSGVEGVVHVATGATAPWQATGSVTGSGDVSCKVTAILRTDNPDVVPPLASSTTTTP
jgi:hypothetical protein